MAAVARRVIVWGTGNVGRAALRAVLADPGLALAGVVVSQAEKVGRDAGALCDRPPTGVVARAGVAAVLAAGAGALYLAGRNQKDVTQGEQTASGASLAESV